jgi:hypothetical protein
MGEFLEIDPATLRLPGSRIDGADPAKLYRQIAKHGKSLEGMPPILVSRAKDGELVINKGVTRASRAARLRPGALVPVDVIDDYPVAGSRLPTVGEKL